MAQIKLIDSKFTKINSSKNPDFSGDVTIKTNIKITEIEIIKTNFIKIKYNFEVNYGELGQIYLEGFLIFSSETKTLNEIKKSWEDKKIDSKEYISILNFIIHKATIKTIEIEDELILPIHLKLPVIESK